MQLTLKQFYSKLSGPVMVPATSSTAIATLILVIDILVSFAVFYSGNSIALSHISGFIVSGSLLMLLRLTCIDKSETDFSNTKVIQKILLLIVYTFVQLAIRGGCIASLSHMGLTDSLALILGMLLAAGIGVYSSALLLLWPSVHFSSNEKSTTRWMAVGIALIICVFILRLVFLNGLEVIPQEAYYWNYAQHLSPGYLDHPPLVATTIYAGEFLFGHSILGSRFGAFVYGVVFIIFFYRYARLQVDQTCAVFAAALTLLLPYYFLGSGFLITPDAGLTMAWVMAVYYFYKALVENEKKAWYGVGVAMGIGMLSKYSIALLAPAALLFILFDARARRQLISKEPYIAVVLAALIFSPVIYWNITNDWASFAFQAVDRFNKEPQFSLDVFLTNILSMVTPLPLLALPYLFVANVFAKDVDQAPPFNPRVRLFIGSFLLLPLAVFAWNALENEPRYNWTGPLWITMLPMLSWLVINAEKIRWRVFSVLFKNVTLPLLFGLLVIYSLLLHSLSVGLPGVAFPFGSARLVGWQEVARNVLAIQKQLPVNSEQVIVIGMDKYFISSKLAYYGRQEFLGGEDKLQVTGTQLVGGDSLMFAYWDPVEKYKGKTVIMLSRDKFELRSGRVNPYFKKVSVMKAFPVYKNDFALQKETIREYYYRVGFGYKPPQ